MGIRRAITIIKLARELDKAERRGQATINVPRWLLPEVKKMLWERQVERAAAKWRGLITDVSIGQWQEALERHINASTAQATGIDRESRTEDPSGLAEDQHDTDQPGCIEDST